VGQVLLLQDIVRVLHAVLLRVLQIQSDCVQVDFTVEPLGQLHSVHGFGLLGLSEIVSRAVNHTGRGVLRIGVGVGSVFRFRFTVSGSSDVGYFFGLARRFDCQIHSLGVHSELALLRRRSLFLSFGLGRLKDLNQRRFAHWPLRTTRLSVRRAFRAVSK